MSYATVAEADDRLGHVAAWMALDAFNKQHRLTTAMVWLNATYDWPGTRESCEYPAALDPEPEGYPYEYGVALPQELIRLEWPRVDFEGRAVCDTSGCEITGVPEEVRMAEIIAARNSLVTPLFAAPAQASDGAVTRRKIKAGSVEIDKTFSEPARAADGSLVISEVDAILRPIAPRRGTQATTFMLAM